MDRLIFNMKRDIKIKIHGTSYERVYQLIGKLRNKKILHLEKTMKQNKINASWYGERILHFEGSQTKSEI